MLSFELCAICENTFSYRTPPAADSAFFLLKKYTCILNFFSRMGVTNECLYFPAPSPGPDPLPCPPICVYRLWHPVCIYRPRPPIRIYRLWLPMCIYRPWPTILLPVRGLSLHIPTWCPQFVFTTLAYDLYYRSGAWICIYLIIGSSSSGSSNSSSSNFFGTNNANICVPILVN